MERCCGTCKYLDVPADSIVKSGRTHARLDSRVFGCLVPTPVWPKIPECFEIITEPKRRMMCPQYGKSCETWEGRDGRA